MEAPCKVTIDLRKPKLEDIKGGYIADTEKNCQSMTIVINNYDFIVERDIQTSYPSPTDGCIKKISNPTCNQEKWKKHHYCYLCTKKIDRLSNHFRNYHKHIPNLLAKVPREIIKELYKRLTKEGDYAHFKSQSKLNDDCCIPVRVGIKNHQKKLCARCHGFYSAKLITRHKCRNALNTKLGLESNIEMAKDILKVTPKENEDFLKNVLGPLRDDFREQILKDKAIMSYGCLLYQPKKPRRHTQIIRNNMRTLLRLKQEIERRTSEKMASFADVLTADKFDTLCEAASSLANMDKNGKEKSSVIFQFGKILRVLVNVLISQSIKEIKLREVYSKKNNNNCRNEIKKLKILLDDLKSFKEVFEIQWAQKVSIGARYTAKTKLDPNIENIMPLESDLRIFNEGLDSKIECLKENLSAMLVKLQSLKRFYFRMENKIIKDKIKKEIATKEKLLNKYWRELAQALLVKITAFNARRPFEAGLITIEQYNSRIQGSASGNIDMVHMLTETERLISRSMSLVWVTGKNGRKVPILLTNAFCEVIDFLNEHRSNCGLPERNKHVFPVGDENSMHASSLTKKFVTEIANKCEMLKPELITAKQFRRVLATNCQFLNFNDNEIEILCRHLGHDFKTHNEKYRMTNGAAELAKVAKFLMAVDLGQVASQSGRTFNELEIKNQGKRNNSLKCKHCRHCNLFLIFIELNKYFG